MNINEENNNSSKQSKSPFEATQLENKYSNKNGNNSVKKRFTVILFVSCILLSSLFGFAGGFCVNYFKVNNSKNLSLISADNSNSKNIETGVTSIANSVGDSVVEITTEVVTTGSFMRQYVAKGAGSGVIVSEDGYLITNNHVIDEAKKITVTLKNGTSYDGNLIATDSKADVALIKIEANELKPVIFGDSSKLEVGQLAVAIGNPLGQLGGTVTNGIISALNRDITIDGETMNLLQTNAAINPGNSGGGLFNENGELIGLVVAKSSGTDVEGLGFAIPSNEVKDVVNELSNYGYVRGRIEMQVSLVDVNSTQKAMMYGVNQLGVYVSKVGSGSNAEKAGLAAGDCIISVKGTNVSTAEEVENIINSCKVGDNIEFIVLRNGQKVTLNIILQEHIPNK